MVKKAIPLPIPIEEPKEEECPKCPPVGAPAWMATFADMATLLMAFFVLILSFAEFSKPKFKQIAGSLKNSFGVQRILPVVEQPRGTTMLELKFSPSPQPTIMDEMKQETTQSELPRLEVKTKEEGQDGRKRELAEALVSALESGKVKASVRQNEVVLEFSSNRPGTPNDKSSAEARTEDQDTSKSDRKIKGQGSPGQVNGNEGEEGSKDRKGEEGDLARQFQRFADLIDATKAKSDKDRSESVSRYEDEVAIRAEDSSARNAASLTEFEFTAGPNEGDAQGGSNVGTDQGGAFKGEQEGGQVDGREKGGPAIAQNDGGNSDGNESGGLAQGQAIGGSAQQTQTGGAQERDSMGGLRASEQIGGASESEDIAGQTQTRDTMQQSAQNANRNQDAEAQRSSEREAERKRVESNIKATMAEAKLRVALRQVVQEGLVEIDKKEDKVFITVGAGGAFPSGSADLTAQAQDIVQRISFSAMDEDSSITVTGHTDDVPIAPGGVFRDNWDLAAARSASIVREIAGTNLIDPTRLQAVSKGETAPRADNTTAQGREQNRRIEIEITY